MKRLVSGAFSLPMPPQPLEACRSCRRFWHGGILDVGCQPLNLTSRRLRRSQFCWRSSHFLPTDRGLHQNPGLRGGCPTCGPCTARTPQRGRRLSRQFDRGRDPRPPRPGRPATSGPRQMPDGRRPPELPGPSGRWERQPRPGPGLLVKGVAGSPTRTRRGTGFRWPQCLMGRKRPLSPPLTTADGGWHQAFEGGEVISGFVAPFLAPAVPAETRRDSALVLSQVTAGGQRAEADRSAPSARRRVTSRGDNGPRIELAPRPSFWLP